LAFHEVKAETARHGMACEERMVTTKVKEAAHTISGQANEEAREKAGIMLGLNPERVGEGYEELEESLCV